MSETASDTIRSGGLPEDDGSLDGFALPPTAAAAFAPTARTRRPAPATEPHAPSGGRAADPVATPTTVNSSAGPSSVPHAAPHAYATLPAPAQAHFAPTAPSRADSQDPLPCLIMVDLEVRRRFEHYQTAQRLATGHEPTNAIVVRRAFLHAKRHSLFHQLRETVRHQQHTLTEEDDDPDGLFGDVPTRRVERGRTKSRTQQSFRPSGRELAVYDAYSSHHGFPNRSDFLNELLDAFLPPLPSAPKRTAGR
ncbi:hypothetical protein GCM10010276_87980 [Streptomyces longisporus]|uniref:Uncharacterized protein n=2 Tax=Streptomyces longisporus TaxID=1948 RepID=A0ABP6ATU2_STRLO